MIKDQILQIVRDNIEQNTEQISNIWIQKYETTPPAYAKIKKNLLSLIREGKIERKMRGTTTIYSIIEKLCEN